jgi:hypothetical protein
LSDGGVSTQSLIQHRSLFSRVHRTLIENANYRGKMPLPLFKMESMFKTKADCY